MAGVFLFTARILLFLYGFTRPPVEPSVVFTSGNITVCHALVAGDSLNCYERQTVSLFHRPVSTVSYLQSDLFIAADLHRTPTLLLWSRMTDSLPYRPRPTGSRRASFIAALLLMAGDVEYNPGPRSAVQSASQLTTTIKIGCLNCRSAVNKTAVLHDIIHDQQLDMLLLSETWLTTDTPSSMLLDIAPSGFAALHVVRSIGMGKPSRGGGLAAVFRQSVPVRVHPLADKFQPSTCELQLLRVGSATPPLTVVNIYRPHWMSSVAGFVDELTDIIASLTSDYADNIVLCGDLNCPGVDDSSVDAQLAEGLESLGLRQLIAEPTRCVPGASNLLDVLATSNTALVTNIKVSSADFVSDHSLITANVISRVSKPVVSYVSRNLRAVDPVQFETALRSSVVFTEPATTVDSYVDQLDGVLTALLDQVAPARLRRRRQPKAVSKWLSNEAIEAKRTRRRLERRWRASRLESDRAAYRRACRSANQLINTSRTEYYRSRLQAAGTDYRQRWRTVNELLHSHDSDRTRTDEENKDLCGTFASYFVDKISQLRDRVRDTFSSLPVLLSVDLSDPPHVGPLFTAVAPVTADEVLKVLHSSPHKSSTMDTIPTSLLMSCSQCFSEIIAYLANLSFSEGKFPTRFKTASVTPLLKKPTLDKTSPTSYRPISNLNFISKVLERLFLRHLRTHILASPNFNQNQSAYRSGHSTETALLLLLDRIYYAADGGRSTLLVSLDLSAAFDTISHDILLSRLNHSFGVAGVAHSWIKSYLSDRSQFVRIGSHTSPPVTCQIGVPQGSVLGPLLFSIYTSPISKISMIHNVQQQQYADDTQLYVAVTPTELKDQVSALQSCLVALQTWFCQNGMALNPDKSDAILIGTAQRAHSYSNLTSVNVAGTTVPLASHISILGAKLDSNLTLDNHTNSVSRSCFYHIRALRQIRGALDNSTAATLASALVSARLDYANSILYGTSTKQITRLQRVQNALARVVVPNRPPGSSSLHLLKQLHWLPVEWRIKFKIATLTFKVLETGLPPYLSQQLCPYVPTRGLRSSSSKLLQVPRTNLRFGSRSFHVSAPTIWNSIPLSVRSCESLTTFRKHLKTLYFQSAFSVAP